MNTQQKAEQGAATTAQEWIEWKHIDLGSNDSVQSQATEVSQTNGKIYWLSVPDLSSGRLFQKHRGFDGVRLITVIFQTELWKENEKKAWLQNENFLYKTEMCRDAAEGRSM